jgi:hypothetical protein
MELVPVTEKYFEFIRQLRVDPRNTDGFLEQVSITPDQQKKYMENHATSYYVCLLYGTPVGYVGVIDDDIRICTDHGVKSSGVGSFMLSEIKKLYPSATGRIKKNNVASQRLFEKCEVPYKLI